MIFKVFQETYKVTSKLPNSAKSFLTALCNLQYETCQEKSAVSVTLKKVIEGLEMCFRLQG